MAGSILQAQYFGFGGPPAVTMTGVTQGSTLVLVFFEDNQGVATTINSDGSGDVWPSTAAATVFDTPTSSGTVVRVLPNATAGTHAIDIQKSSGWGGNSQNLLLEIAGVTTNPLDSAVTVTTTYIGVAQPHTLTSGTPSQANTMLIATYQWQQNFSTFVSVAEGSGWTLGSNLAENSFGGTVYFKNLTSATPTGDTFTTSPSNNNGLMTIIGLTLSSPTANQGRPLGIRGPMFRNVPLRAPASTDAQQAAIAGTEAATDQADSLAAVGTAAVAGTDATTDALDAMVMVGTVAVAGTDATLDAPDTMAAAGTSTVLGTQATTDSPDTLAAAGTASVLGTVAPLDSPDLMVASSSMLLAGTIAALDSPDTMVGTSNAPDSGTTAVVDSPDLMAASGTAAVAGTIATLDSLDAWVGVGTVDVAGTASMLDQPDILTATGPLSATLGTIAAADSPDAMASAGGVLVSGTSALVDAPDAMAASGQVLVSGTTAVLDSPDGMAASSAMLMAGSLLTTDAPDKTASSGLVSVPGTLIVTDAADSLSGVSTVSVLGTLATTDVADSMLANDGAQAAGVVVAEVTTPVAFDASVVVLTWGLLQNNGDFGDMQSFINYGAKTFVVSGTFTGNTSVAIEGSNDGANWKSLSDNQGNALFFTTGGIATSQDRPQWVRPRILLGPGGASITVTAACHHTDWPVRK